MLEAPRSVMDDPKVINDIKARLDETYLAEETLAAPTKYDLAVSVVCDIDCPYCPRQKLRDLVRSGTMKPAQFEPVEPYLRYSQRTGLYGLGEPFLNKHFFTYLDAARRQGSYTMTSSHGMTLSEDVCRKLIDAGLDELAVSIDGATRKTFNFLREGADFDAVVANVRRLVTMRDAAGSPTPKVHIACALSRHNVYEMVPMVWLSKRLRVDRLVFSNIIFVKEEDAHLNIVGTQAFRFNWALARRLGRLLRLETLYFYQKPFPWKKEYAPLRPGARFGCPSAWSSYVVERDGNLKPCCYLDDSLGNTTDGAFGEVFNNEAARNLRRTFLTGDLRNECRECGMLLEVSSEHVRRCLREVAAMIGTTDLSAPVRQDLNETLARYEDLAREAGFLADAPTPSSQLPAAAPSRTV